MMEVRVKETEEFKMGIGLGELMLKDWDCRWILVNWYLEQYLQESCKLIVNTKGMDKDERCFEEFNLGLSKRGNSNCVEF